MRGCENTKTRFRIAKKPPSHLENLPVIPASSRLPERLQLRAQFGEVRIHCRPHDVQIHREVAVRQRIAQLVSEAPGHLRVLLRKGRVVLDDVVAGLGR